MTVKVKLYCLLLCLSIQPRKALSGNQCSLNCCLLCYVCSPNNLIKLIYIRVKIYRGEKDCCCRRLGSSSRQCCDWWNRAGLLYMHAAAACKGGRWICWYRGTYTMSYTTAGAWPFLEGPPVDCIQNGAICCYCTTIRNL